MKNLDFIVHFKLFISNIPVNEWLKLWLKFWNLQIKNKRIRKWLKRAHK